MEALLDAYANTTITFNLSGITRTINDTWARNDDDKGMKRFLRRGTYKTLNIYFQTDLQMTPYSGPAQPDSHTTTSLVRAAVTSESSSSSSAPSVLGFCTLPDPAINSSSPLDDYILDGCNIHALTMPGGPWPGYSLGGHDNPRGRALAWAVTYISRGELSAGSSRGLYRGYARPGFSDGRLSGREGFVSGFAWVGSDS